MNTPADGGLELAGFYRFHPLAGLPLLRERLLARARELGLRGTVLLAPEGVNGSLVGAPAALDAFIDTLAGRTGIPRPVCNRQPVSGSPFLRLKVRIRPEIIRFDYIDPEIAHTTGEHVDPGQWNDLIRRRNVRLVDTRNDYEVALGTFEGAENPHTDTFRDFIAWAESQLDPDHDREVAMFCTGGVRCEKAAAWLKQRGFERVYQLSGGILGYLSAVPPERQTWRGECFVFDDRISVDASLNATGRRLCAACQRPADRLDSDGLPPLDAAGGTCRACHETLDPGRHARLTERARQIRLAEDRGEAHLGPEAGPS